MNFEKTFYVIGPDEETDRNIPSYNTKMNKLYESPEPARKALDNIIEGYKRIVHYSPVYQDYIDRLEKKQILLVRVISMVM